MAEGFKKSADQIQPEADSFNSENQFRTLQEGQESMQNAFVKQGLVIAEHQGNIKGIFPALSAVQSSLSAVQASLGAWLTVAGIVASVLFGLAIFNLTRTNSVDSRLGGLEARAGSVEAKLSILPQQVAHELRQQEADSAPAPLKRARP